LGGDLVVDTVGFSSEGVTRIPEEDADAGLTPG
jgi:hypothetical protein